MSKEIHEDQPLVEPAGGLLEATYAAWALVWIRDYGAGANLAPLEVTDIGTTYTSDGAGPTGHVRTLGGVEQNIANYLFVQGLMPYSHTFSRTGRYGIGLDQAALTIDVWRDDVLIWSRDPILDLADFAADGGIMISSSGEFVAVIAISIATGNPRYVMLYRGS